VTETSSAARIEPLTGLRGVAALWVLVHHLHGFPGQTVPDISWSWAFHAFRNFASKGWLGVDLFFVLSGFIISYVHRDEFSEFRLERYFRFLVLRISRIYPAHLVTTLLLIPMFAIAWITFDYRSQGNNLTVAKLAYSVLLLNGWGIPNSVGWNIPSWSVSSEWLAYLCFPVIAFVTTRIRSSRISLVLAAFIALAAILLSAQLNGTSKFMFDEDLTALRVLYEFVIGCLLFNIFLAVRGRARFDAMSTLSVLVIVVLATASIPSRFDWLFILVFSTLILGLSTMQRSSFASRPMVYLGEISYSIYLIHSLVINAIDLVSKRVFEHPHWTAGIAFAVLSFVLSIVGGHVLYVLVERPWRRRLRARWGPPSEHNLKATMVA
jgi:peptidoglycan/LPS O-acetylase OafA/YrhL